MHLDNLNGRMLNVKILKIMTITLLLAISLSISITAFAVPVPTITIGSASGKPGETVSIPVLIENNSGIIALYCDVSYDGSSLKLTEVTNGDVLTGPAHSGSLTTNPYRLCFDMSLASENNTKNGIIATLEFEILPAAKSGDSAITITYNPDEIYDFNLNNVRFETQNGKVAVNSRNPNATQSNNNTTSKPSDKPDSKPENKDNSSPETDNRIKIDVDSKSPSTEPNDKIEVIVNSSEKTPWDKITIGGNNINEKNITTEQTDEGLIIRGDDLSGIAVEIQKSDKKATVTIDTEQKKVLLKENENDEVAVYIDSDDTGAFETPITPSKSFEDAIENGFPLELKILAPVIIIAIVVGIVVFIKTRRTRTKKA